MHRQAWQRVINQFEHSDLSQQEFADSKGVNIGTFRYWPYRLRREYAEQKAGSAAFVEVTTIQTVADSASAVACCVLLDHGEVHFNELPPASWVVELLGGRAPEG